MEAAAAVVATEAGVEAAAGTSTEGDWEVGAGFSIAVMG